MALLKPKIVIIPLGEVDFMMVNKVASAIGPVFNRSIDILKGMKMPQEALHAVRNQYYATVVLAKLERIKATSREKVVGICEEDLYLPEENIVLGYADSLAGTAIMSLYHIRQEFYGLPEDEAKIYPRLFKEVVHQVSHLFELNNCRNPRCVNYHSKLMLDIDSKGTNFCDVCRRQLTGLV